MNETERAFDRRAGGVAKQIGLFHPDMGLELNGSLPVLWLSGQPPVATRIIKVRIARVQRLLFVIRKLASVRSRLACSIDDNHASEVKSC